MEQNAGKQIEANEYTRAHANEFVKYCTQMVQNALDVRIKAIGAELAQKVETHVKCEVMQSIGTKNMFDYTKIIVPPLQDQRHECITLREYFGRLRSALHGNFEADAADFLDFIDEEKVVLHAYWPICLGRPYDMRVLITNYARCIWMEGDDQGRIFTYQYQKFEYWLPKDYIFIMYELLSRYDPVNECGNSTFIHGRNFINVLDLIKRQLWDRTFVPLYVRDLAAENEKLRAENDLYLAEKARFESERREFETHRAHFEDHIRPFTDIEKEKEELIKERERLADERNKLRLAIRKINVERDELRKERELLDKVDLADI